MPRCEPTDLTECLYTATGTYALILACAKSGRIDVGRAGILELKRGYYVYVGSAFGPGGIRARIKHHLRFTAAPHWHIDYLKHHCTLRELWLEYSAVKGELNWVEKIARHKDARVPLNGFGASDSRSASHLFRFERRPRAADVLGGRRPAEVLTCGKQRCLE